ncbi:AmmeMemoRadiSam system protein B [Candidatus Peregrinibacteria bacterium]|nr:AmmeMemoRadiSam system protein B [Candidatus Peregrinibacteria bacterium]
MRKLFFLFGALVAITFLWDFNNGNQLSDNIFGLDTLFVDNETYEYASEAPPRLILDLKKYSDTLPKGYFSHFDFFEDEILADYSSLNKVESFSKDIKASIVSSDIRFGSGIAEYFERLSKTREIETFVIITENLHLNGYQNIQVSNYGYNTSLGKLSPDMGKVRFLNDMGFNSSNRTFYHDENTAILAPFIQKSFPEAKFVAINIKNMATEDEINTLITFLPNIIDDRTIIISPMTFSQGMNDHVAGFHNELALNIVETLDTESVGQIDSASKTNLKLLFEILEKYNWEKSEISMPSVQDGFSSIFVNYFEGEIEGDRDLTIMAFGDLMPGRYVRTLMDRHGKDYIFENIRGPNNSFFKGADYIFANLEGPIKGQGYKSGTSLVFGFNENIAPFLKRYGFNLFTIANNHAVDQGWDGRTSTIESLNKHDIGWCGHPSEVDKESVFYDEINGKKLAFACFQDVTYRLDDEAALNLIKEIRPNVDYLIVSIHWGVEYKHRPSESLEVSPGRAFVDAGADAIIGHHPHVVQSFEIYKDRLIFYSLGNFVFDQYWSVETQEELGIGLVLDDSPNGKMTSKAYLFPMKSEASKPRLMTEEEYAVWIEKFISYGNYSDALKEQIRKGLIVVE